MGGGGAWDGGLGFVSFQLRAKKKRETVFQIWVLTNRKEAYNIYICRMWC